MTPSMSDWKKAIMGWSRPSPPHAGRESFLRSEIRPLDHFGFGELAGGAAEGHLAELEEIEVVRHLERHVGVLLDQEDRRTVAVELADDAEDLLDHERRQAHRGLVHEQQLRTH